MKRDTKPRRVIAHTGKVARLPQAVREELNRRLFRGDAEADVLAWLHADPAARETLEAQFGGTPVTPGQLAVWRRTGYAEWATREEAKGRRLAPLKRAMAETETGSWMEKLRAHFRPVMGVESAEVKGTGDFLSLVVNGIAAEVLPPDFHLLAMGIVVMRGGPPHSMAPFPLPKRLAGALAEATDDPVVVELARRQLNAEQSGFPRVPGPREVPTLAEATAARWKVMPKAKRIERVAESSRGGAAGR